MHDHASSFSKNVHGGGRLCALADVCNHCLWRRISLSARDDCYRYIRYPGGTEELYDHQADPHEFKNQAHRPDLEPVKQRLARWVPQQWAQSLGGRSG